MPFFQNPFVADFQGNWVLADRQHSPSFRVPRNSGRGDELSTSYEDGPFDLSGVDADGDTRDTLQIFIALFPEFRTWVRIVVDITTFAASTAAVTHVEIVDALNDDTGFSGWFTAETNVSNGRTMIRSKRSGTEFHYYVENGRAEEALRFNARAGVAEIPSYFDRHKVVHLLTVAERDSFTDNVNHLLPLDPVANTVDANLIDAAVDVNGNSLGLDSSTVQGDWELLEGRSGLFTFQNICLDTNGDIAQIIEFHAGAVVGDTARRICYFRNAAGAGSNPIQITEEPYVLTTADLITPDCSECV